MLIIYIERAKNVVVIVAVAVPLNVPNVYIYIYIYVCVYTYTCNRSCSYNQTALRIFNTWNQNYGRVYSQYALL